MSETESAALHAAVLLPFGEAIYRLRVRQGWSQEQLGVVADLHRDTVMQVENGRGDPHLSTLIALLFPFGLVLPCLPMIVNPQPHPRRSEG